MKKGSFKQNLVEGAIVQNSLFSINSIINKYGVGKNK